MIFTSRQEIECPTRCNKPGVSHVTGSSPSVGQSWQIFVFVRSLRDFRGQSVSKVLRRVGHCILILQHYKYTKRCVWMCLWRCSWSRVSDPCRCWAIDSLPSTAYPVLFARGCIFETELVTTLVRLVPRDPSQLTGQILQVDGQDSDKHDALNGMRICWTLTEIYTIYFCSFSRYEIESSKALGWKVSCSRYCTPWPHPI